LSRPSNNQTPQPFSDENSCIECGGRPDANDMSDTLPPHGQVGLEEAISQLREAAGAKKCWTCSCLHHTLAAIEGAFPAGHRPPHLNEVITAVRQRLKPVTYECLGCQVCYPGLAINALAQGAAEKVVGLQVCPTEAAEERQGWPPLPGSYTVLRYHGPIAVCTLTDADLASATIRAAPPDVALAGTLQTENLGIERLILNVVANPHIRFLIVGGTDSRQAIGHLPGQSLVALARAGLDERARIVGARGKRPVLRNISAAAIAHFRRTIEVVDLIGTTDVQEILNTVHTCAARHPGPADAFTPERLVAPLSGYLPRRMVPDPAGYFVIDVDHARHLISLEHYRQDGLLDRVIEGHQAAALYTPAIEKGLVSRLDHAAYLGRELARAEQALAAGPPYVQDAAPEADSASDGAACGCDSAGAEATP
jgi:tetrahydromethanopterin S-methyltransferase subunit A